MKAAMAVLVGPRSIDSSRSAHDSLVPHSACFGAVSEPLSSGHD